MRKISGFTLIELVIVIIILGILAATAVPKFVNLQSDARHASLKGLKAALVGAADLVYSRAVLDGLESQATSAVSVAGSTINTVYGYPSVNSIQNAVNIGSSDWNFSVSGSTATGTIAGYSAANCNVTYAQATGVNAPPVVSVTGDGC